MSELQALSDRFWDLSMEASPSAATLLGDHRFDHLLEDLSPEFLEASMAALGEVVSEASSLDASNFDRQDRITQAMLLSEASDALTMLETRVLVASPDPLTGPASGLLMYAGQTAAADSKQAAAFYERYRLVPRLLAQALALHHEEIGAGRTPIAANVRRVMSVVDDYLASPLESDPFANLAGPEDWDGFDTWRDQMTSLVKEQIRPAFANYREGVEDLLTVSRDEDHSGLCHIAGGEEIYTRMIEVFTTLPYSAQELHDLGQSQAKGVHADEFRDIGRRAFGTSDLPKIIDRLRNDPELRYSTSDEIVADAERILARAWEASSDWFNLRPVGSCSVQAVPDFMAKNAPPAYYFPPASDGSRPGTYFINTYEPDQRARYEAESTAFHEANPGHHFQLTLAAELTGIPEFRKRAISTAYVEGWGLYAERLADEMGVYTSDLDRLGMVSADAWRAGRLVVDTGVHFLGWSRRQAVEFLEGWTAIDQPTIETEVDRYIGVPGQALAYKAGQIEIFRLREEARLFLGDRFEIKGFHDTVLGSGSMPLPMLGDLVAEWVKPGA